MVCPRCKSERIQRGYKDSFILFRLAGHHQLLCNNCGLEFKGFDPFGQLKRAPVTEQNTFTGRRRAPRFKAHLPANITLVEREADTGKLIFSQSSRGHCESISKIGLGLTFVGSRFASENFDRTGRLLFLSIVLPNGAIDALVTTITHTRREPESGLSGWSVGAAITQMSEADRSRLLSYLEKREKEEPLLEVE